MKKIILVEGDKIISEDGRNATVLNNLFANTVKNLKIPEHHEADTRTVNILQPALKAVLNTGNRPSIDAIKNVKTRENLNT